MRSSLNSLTACSFAHQSIRHRQKTRFIGLTGCSRQVSPVLGEPDAEGFTGRELKTTAPEVGIGCIRI